MGDYITGDEWQAFVLEQTTFLGLLHPAANHAFEFIDATITPQEERKPRDDNRGTNSRGETIRLKKSGSVTINAYLKTSGSLGVLSDMSPFEKHAYGAQAVNGGASIVNSLAKNPEDTLFGLSVHFMADFTAFHCKGCVVQSIVYDLPGDNEATMAITLDCAEIIQTGASTVQAILSGGESSFTPAFIDITNFSAGSKVDIGSSTGHIVGSEPSGGSVSINPNIVGAQAINSVIGPTIIAGTPVNSDPISGIAGSYKMDALDVQSISHKITVTCNRTIRNKTYGTAIPDGYYSGKKREITFESMLILSRPNMRYATGAQKLVQYDLELVAGDTAGSRVRFDMNKVEFDIPEIATNNEDEAEVTVSGYALPTNDEDEMTQTYD